MALYMNSFPDDIDGRNFMLSLLRLKIFTIITNTDGFPKKYVSDNRYYEYSQYEYSYDNGHDSSIKMINSDDYINEKRCLQQIADELSDRNFICEVSSSTHNNGNLNSQDYQNLCLIIDLPKEQPQNNYTS
jgi:hypothetical protein